MKLGPIALRIRVSNTRFGELVGGAAELAVALGNTFDQECAFVIPLAENVGPNKYDPGINQRVVERFGVVVALKNDLSDVKKLGLAAYDSVHDVRAELWSAILGWQLVSLATKESSIIYYRGGRILDITRANLWYQYEFELWTRIEEADGVAAEETDDFNSIYAQYILTPSADIPYDSSLPFGGTVDMDQIINLEAEALRDKGEWGPFHKGFGTGFDWYNI